jgi:hypothetical protein
VASIFWTPIGTELAPGKNRALAYPSTRFSTLEAGFSLTLGRDLLPAKLKGRRYFAVGRSAGRRSDARSRPRHGSSASMISAFRPNGHFAVGPGDRPGWYSMRSSHYALGKDSAGAAYFLSSLTTAPVAQSSEIRAATEPPPTSASRSGTCRQLVEQTGDSAARWHRNHAEMCSALNY